jgi:hypothetical protein
MEKDSKVFLLIDIEIKEADTKTSKTWGGYYLILFI